MNPKLAPGPAEKTASAVMYVGMVFLFAGLMTLAWSSGPGNYAYYLASLFCSVAGGATIYIGVALGSRSMKERVGLIKDYKKALALAAADMPDLSNLSTSGAIVTLRWSLNYDSHLTIMQAFKKSVWYLWRWIALYPILLVAFCFLFIWTQFRQPMVYTSFLAIIVGTVIGMRTSIQQLRQRYLETPIQNFCLVVDTDRLRLVTGTTVTELPWKQVQRIQNVKGTTYIHVSILFSMIPNFVFHSRRDAEAFFATVKSLKAGLPPPAYDWSGYVFTEPNFDGVWPPPIRP